MARANLATADLVIGIVLVVLGGLALLGWLDLRWLVTVAAIAAIVVGILVLIGRTRGNTVLGVLLIVIGIVLLVPNFLRDELGSAIATIGAVLLLILGILKLLGKW
jgi:hypothetical protein